MIALSPAQLFELARIADRHGPLNLEHRPDRRVAVTIAEHPLLVELAIDVGGDTGWLGLMAARTLPAGGGSSRTLSGALDRALDLFSPRAQKAANGVVKRNG